jgi:hypothetical protein
LIGWTLLPKEDLNMSALQIPYGQYATLIVAGNGSSGQGATALMPGANSIMLNSTDYASAYLVDLGLDTTTGGEKIAIVPRASAPPPVGGSITVTVQCTGKDKASGNPLNQLSEPVVIEGATPAPPAATNFGFFSSAFLPLASAPADPGSNVLSF